MYHFLITSSANLIISDQVFCLKVLAMDTMRVLTASIMLSFLFINSAIACKSELKVTAFEGLESVGIFISSLDDDAKVPIAGNVSLPALTNGSHRLTLYATDEIGNPGSKTVYFSISPFPTVMLAAIIAIVVIAVAAGYLFVKRRKVGGNQAIVTSAKSLDKEADSEI